MIASAILFGAIATVCTGFLFTLRTLRPLLAGVTRDFSQISESPPRRARRLLLMWTVCTALPGLAIALLLIMRSNGWIIQKSTPIELALLVLALVAVVLGFRAMILVSLSISDPLNEVVDAMAEVQRGRDRQDARRIRMVRNRATSKRIQPDGRWTARARTAARSVRPSCR